MYKFKATRRSGYRSRRLRQERRRMQAWRRKTHFRKANASPMHRMARMPVLKLVLLKTAARTRPPKI